MNHKKEQGTAPEPNPEQGGLGTLIGLALLALVLLGTLVQLRAVSAPFLFDDQRSILENPHVQSLWPLDEALGAVKGSGSHGRPLVALSLAVNYALGGFDVRGYHWFNIGAHVLAALALFGLVRRAALTRFPARRSLGIAFASALIWCLHPLHTDALNHIVYRNGTLMALFYLLTMGCALAGFLGKRRRLWYGLSIGSCALAMCSKEVAISAPLVVLLMDRALVSGSLREAWRKHRRLYIGLAATWLVLGLCVWSGSRGGSVGANAMGRLDYLRTQAYALTRYMQLAVWPDGLVFDYGEVPRAFTWAQLWPRALLQVLLLGYSLWACVRNRVEGWLSLAYFAILAPTSSFIPLAGELVGEHRMVLPLACLTVLFVLGVDRLLTRVPGSLRAWVAGLMLIGVASALGLKTHQRNGDYQSQVYIWSDTVEKMPGNSRALNFLANALLETGKLKPALRAVDSALAIAPKEPTMHNTRAAILFKLRDFEATELALTTSLRLNPDRPSTHASLAKLLASQGRFEQSLVPFERALARLGGDVPLRLAYATALRELGRSAQAAQQFREILRASPAQRHALQGLGWILATSPDDRLRNGAEALRIAERLEPVVGNNARRLDLLAAAHAELGQIELALSFANRALEKARQRGNDSLRRAIEGRIEQYRSGQPYREPAKGDDPR